MAKRFVAIWFPYLATDWFIRRRPCLKGQAFVLAEPSHGRMVVKSASIEAHKKGILPGMVVADCKAIFPELQVFDYQPDLEEKLLKALGEWCIRFTPVAAIDLPHGLILEATGCAHLWGGEQVYLKDIFTRLQAFGYHVQAAIADTIGAAWAVSRYGNKQIVDKGQQLEAMLSLPPAALRLDIIIVERLTKLGLYQIRGFINMPRSALRRRFGHSILTRLDQALGQEIEAVEPIVPVEPYQERLPCLEPIRTAHAIEIALKKLLEQLCKRLDEEEIGLRKAVFTCYRIDGNIQQIDIGTNRASRNAEHLFRLFEIKIPVLMPDLGFELFVLTATKTEPMPATQDALWNTSIHNDIAVAELLDRIAGKAGMENIHRYLPDEHYWPERSIKKAASYDEQPSVPWRTNLPRPVLLLPKPELIEVTVPIPDYPPMLFKYKDMVHTVKKADGPERIEQEWWLQQGSYRDYYCVEDEQGCRYWLFRAGDYASGNPEWYIHGFFA